MCLKKKRKEKKQKPLALKGRQNGTLNMHATSYQHDLQLPGVVIVQELCESRGGRPGLSALTSLLVSVDVKLY